MHPSSETPRPERRDLLLALLKRSSRTEWSRRLNPHLDREYIVPILLNALVVQDLLREHPQGPKIDQIKLLTGIPKTTVYRILRTYVATGHIHSVDSGQYFLMAARCQSSDKDVP